jgi:predicted permease
MTSHLESLLRDVRFTARQLAGRPGWTTAALVCLAIATGANTAAFSVVNGLLLRPLPFPEPDRLVMVAIREARQTSTRPFALREYRQLARASQPTGMLLARTFFPLSLVGEDGARMAQAELVSGNYFATLRVSPFLGRFFDANADREHAPLVTVLSHRLWEVRFGADPAAIGKSVRVNGRTAVITAVAPRGFVGAMRLIAADLWLPAAMYPDLAGSADAATTPMFGVMGRLADGLPVYQAEAAMSAAHVAAAHLNRGEAPPAVVLAPATGFGVPVAVHGTVLTLSGLIYLLMALLMTVACANVAALVLARGAGRSREIAIRLSLGASRMRIARQLAIESLVLAAAGCTAGALVAVWLTQAVVAGLSTPFQYVSYAVDVHPDARVLVYSVLTTAAAAVLCGIAPIRLAGRVDVVDALKQSAANGRSRRSLRTLNVMVVLQFAVSTTLLVGAGMLVHSYIRAQTATATFVTAGLVAATFDVDQVQLDRADGIRLYESLVERVSMLPGVSDVGVAREAPFAAGRPTAILSDGHPGASAEPITASAMVASSRYLETLGLTLRQGRAFEQNDPAQPRIAVVNETMAQRLWPDTSPIGRTFRLAETGPEAVQVVGVVENAEARSSGRLAQAAFYQPFPHEYSGRMTVVMRVQGEPSRFYTDVRRIVRELHQDLAIVDLRTVDELQRIRADERRIPATALSLIGLLGLLLSAVGLYGVVAYGVRERAREFGIRLAVGARPADIRRLVLRQGFTTISIGLALGAAAIMLSGQLLRSTVFAIGVADPLLVTAVCAVLVMTGFAALYIPARWASGVEPACTLRSE